LHDLDSDPDELKNLALDPANASTLKEMRELCDQEMNARGGPLLPLEQRKSLKAEKGKGKAKAPNQKGKGKAKSAVE
jgi:hypothetical protein